MKVKCNACGYEWISNKDNEELPKACPSCKQYRKIVKIE